MFRVGLADGKPTAPIPILAILGIAFAFLAVTAAAQTQYPKDEIFGGYSALFPNGWQELDYKSNSIPNAFDVSNTYYFCRFCNLGWVLDGSGHYQGGTTPPNLQNGSDSSTGVGYALTGLQYKWHTDSFSPFVRFRSAQPAFPPTAATARSGASPGAEAAASIGSFRTASPCA